MPSSSHSHLEQAQGPSLWREVEARIHLSLPPYTLTSPTTYATRAAFSQLLMRYNPSLGGVVVAHTGRLKLDGPPRLIGSSPYAHVYATTKLLLFCPTPGAQLLGLITHVGPDHVGMTVLRSFHAVLPTNDPGFPHGSTLRRGMVLRFEVGDVKNTAQGLFQIMATLQESNQFTATAPLGVVHDPPAYAKNVPLEFDDDVQDDQDEMQDVMDVLDFGRRRSQIGSKFLGNGNVKRESNPLLRGFGEEPAFGDPLEPIVNSPLRQTSSDKLEKRNSTVGVESATKRRKRISVVTKEDNVPTENIVAVREKNALGIHLKEEEKEEPDKDIDEGFLLSLTPNTFAAELVPLTPNENEIPTPEQTGSAKKTKKSRKKKNRNTKDSNLTRRNLSKEMKEEQAQIKEKVSTQTSEVTKGKKKNKKNKNKKRKSNITNEAGNTNEIVNTNKVANASEVANANEKEEEIKYNFKEEEWGEVDEPKGKKEEELITTPIHSIRREEGENEQSARTMSARPGLFQYRVSTKIRKNEDEVKTEPEWSSVVQTQQSLGSHIEKDEVKEEVVAVDGGEKKKKNKKRKRKRDSVGENVKSGNGSLKKKKRKLKGALELERMRSSGASGS